MELKRDLFKPLCIFRIAAEEHSFSRAANLLGLSQPAISMAISRLEKEYDCVLFERKRPQVILTPAGKIFYDLVVPLLDGLQNIPDSFADAIGNIDDGEVRVAASEAVLLNFMPEIAAFFKKRHPGILLSLSATIASNIPDLLLNDEVDFAIGSLMEEDTRLRQTEIYDFPTMLVLPIDHRLTRKVNVSLRDVARYPLIVPPRHSYTWQMLQVIFAQNEISYHIALEASSSEVAKRCVAEGLGVAILSEACAMDDDTIVARPFEHFFPHRAYSLIERRGKFLTPQAQRFRQAVLKWHSQKHAET
ncbi:LysR family transcriptional regulator [Suttonella sp. R2A3]|uniref:LysR family transcriptional regulator n=1 Tax=Suttonella sp. R2A3 TaxID=2908648 RepID=UPI001F2116CC|nr:LysR family transcriptional regulator [Suttonella sp. R2A3]UJF23697.1 LysR family transcriptional regulator [Suttonella sp. R2A3]